MLSLDEKAATAVAEMTALGAIFAVEDDGATGDAQWHWRPSISGMRGPIRKFWASVTERDEPGFAAAMVRAIRRLNAGGADV